MKKIISVILGIAILDGLSLLFFWVLNLIFYKLVWWLAVMLLGVFGLGIVWKFSQISIINIPFIVFRITSKIPSYVIAVYAVITSVGFLNTPQYFPSLSFKICIAVGIIRIISAIYYMLLIHKAANYAKYLLSE